MPDTPPLCRAKTPDAEAIRQILLLLLELLKDDETPELLQGGVGACCLDLTQHHYRLLGPLVLESGILGITAAQLRALGAPGEWVLISRGQAGPARMNGVGSLYKCFMSDELQDKKSDAIVASGYFEQACQAVEAAAAAGQQGQLCDVNHNALYASLTLIRGCCDLPKCEKRVRALAKAGLLAWCLDNDLDWMSEIGYSSGAVVAQICVTVFGRDEGGSEFTFTQGQVDQLVTRWSNAVRAVGMGRTHTPGPAYTPAVEL